VCERKARVGSACRFTACRILRRLAFRTLEEVGETAYIEAMSRVLQGSLDSGFKKICADVGPQRAAAEYVDNCPKEDDRNAWHFELGYDDRDNLVGLTMPTEWIFPIKGRSNGCIWMIGVVPEMRGQRFIDDLLARGTKVLELEGVDHIYATTDVANFPMSNAFGRANYNQIEHWWGYWIQLDSDPA